MVGYSYSNCVVYKLLWKLRLFEKVVNTAVYFSVSIQGDKILRYLVHRDLLIIQKPINLLQIPDFFKFLFVLYIATEKKIIHKKIGSVLFTYKKQIPYLTIVFIFHSITMSQR